MNAPLRNNIRLAKVWLDDYAQYYFDRIGNQLVYSPQLCLAENC